MTKYFKSVSTQLDMETYNKLQKICTKEGCKPYAILKTLLTQYIDSYPETPKEGENVESRREEKPGLGNVEEGNDRESKTDSGVPFLSQSS